MDTQQHTETATETPPPTPAVDTAASKEEPVAPKNRSEENEATIQGLVDAIQENRRLQEREALNSEENHKVDYDKLVGELGEDGERFVSNLRRSYTQKTQELAEQRKALEQQAAALREQQEQQAQQAQQEQQRAVHQQKKKVNLQ